MNTDELITWLREQREQAKDSADAYALDKANDPESNWEWGYARGSQHFAERVLVELGVKTRDLYPKEVE